MTGDLSLKEARRVAVRARGINTLEPAGEVTTASVLSRLGCIQINSMSAVRRSHELVLLSRGVSPAQAGHAGTGQYAGVSFEGMAHALSLLPVEMRPYFSFRRRRVRARGWRGPYADAQTVTEARQRLDAEGRVRIAGFGRVTGTGWDRSSPYRWALEWLAATGGAACAERDRRLPQSAEPGSVLKAGVSPPGSRRRRRTPPLSMRTR
jgi:uncharacterized protein YcaQ